MGNGPPRAKTKQAHELDQDLSSSEIVLNMIRALAVPPASVTADQLKALEHAKCYDMATFAAAD